MAKKKKRQKHASARELFERCSLELRVLNQRYESLFRFLHDPQSFAPQTLDAEIVTVTLDRDMKHGESLSVRVPPKLVVLGSDPVSFNR